LPFFQFELREVVAADLCLNQLPDAAVLGLQLQPGHRSHHDGTLKQGGNAASARVVALDPDLVRAHISQRLRILGRCVLGGGYGDAVQMHLTFVRSAMKQIDIAQKAVDEGAGGLGPDLLGRAHLLDHPLIHEYHPVCHFQAYDLTGFFCVDALDWPDWTGSNSGRPPLAAPGVSMGVIGPRGPDALTPCPYALLPMLKAVLKRCVTLLIFGLCASAMATEEPRFEVISAQGSLELRHYDPLLIAETEVSGEMDEASRAGFRLLADFIFGNNQAPESAGSAKIDMTAPVTMQASSAKIAMTAPVTIAPQADRWRVHFVMPRQYTLASIPKPRNPAVRLRQLPSLWFVAHRFSGFATSAQVEAKTQEALQWIAQQGLKTTGAPQLARYDPPWTVPMFRRNEILIPVAGPESERPR